MEIPIHVFWIVLLIVLVHTIFQHLINWLWRYTDTEDDILLALFITIAEFVFLIVSLIVVLYV